MFRETVAPGVPARERLRPWVTASIRLPEIRWAPVSLALVETPYWTAET